MSDKPALPEPVAWLHDGRASIDKGTVLYDHERNIRCGFKPRPVVELFTADQLRAALVTQAEAHAAEVARYKSTMIAAAEEIAAHWEAHCDAEGYGPQNLLRRLEEGFAAEYGYTAGNWERLQSELTETREQLSAHEAIRAQVEAERDALQQALSASMSKCRGIPDSRCSYLAHCYGLCNKCGRQHDAARTGSKP